MRVGYNGHEALTFTDYLDLETGKTLHAEPGRSYDITPASGRVVPEVPEAWFTVIEEAAPDLRSAAAGDDAEPGQAEAAPGLEPDAE